MKNPLVTVYITNHNYGSFIKQAIDSVLEQTLTDFELIIIDDGSTDASKDIIEGYADYPAVRIVYQERRGLNATNNIALRLARGKYIMRLDADDYLDPNALIVLSNTIERDDRIGLVFPDYYLVDRDGHLLGMERRHDFSTDVSLYDQPAHGACTMIRKEYLENVGGYDEQFTCQDGYDLWIKFIDTYEVMNVNLPLFYYRQHGSNLTKNENRILSTRSMIRSAHVKRQRRERRSVGIIPVRGVSVDPSSVAMQELAGRPLLRWVVDTALRTRNLDRVIVTSSDPEVLGYAREIPAGDRLLVIPRPSELGRQNVRAQLTLRYILEQYPVAALNPEVVVMLSTECPFLTAGFMDDAVHAFSLFDIDSVITVRPDHSTFYQHNGHGLHSLLPQDRFTHLERDALFRYAGGLSGFDVSVLRRAPEDEALRLGHVVIDQRSAYAVQSAFDLKVAEFLAQEAQG